MNKQIAKIFAEDIMSKYPVLRNWKFRYVSFTLQPETLAMCNHTRKELQVSGVVTERFTFHMFSQLMYHEIAHAICGHKEGHGPIWLSVARDLGYIYGERVPYEWLLRSLEGVVIEEIAAVKVEEE